MATRLRETTESLLASILHGAPITPGARADFGIATVEDYYALANGVRSGRIKPEALDALGAGHKLTELAKDIDSPLPDVVSKTDWDHIHGRIGPREPVIEPPEEERER